MRRTINEDQDTGMTRTDGVEIEPADTVSVFIISSYGLPSPRRTIIAFIAVWSVMISVTLILALLAYWGLS